LLLKSVALTLIGGVQHVDASGTRIRGESHLLLVGDPGKQLIAVTISGTVDFFCQFLSSDVVGKEKNVLL